MKLMTYNILDGGINRLDLIVSAITSESPNILVLNEANGFLANDQKLAKSFSKKIDMDYWAVAPTEWGYDVAVYSKFPFRKSKILMPYKRAAVSVEVDSEFGIISVVGAHLSPDFEEVRILEVEAILNSQKNENRIIMGDMNALSREDEYGRGVIGGFNEKQIQKFTNHGKPHFEVVDKILASRYVDAAVHLNKNKDTTVPTPSNEDIAHANLRLDYAFISNSLATHLVDYNVIKNEVTDKASDHYPVVVTLR